MKKSSDKRGLVYYYRAGRGLDGVYWVQPLNWHKDGVLENSAVTETISEAPGLGCSKPVWGQGAAWNQTSDELSFRRCKARALVMPSQSFWMVYSRGAGAVQVDTRQQEVAVCTTMPVGAGVPESRCGTYGDKQ